MRMQSSFNLRTAGCEDEADVIDESWKQIEYGTVFY